MAEEWTGQKGRFMTSPIGRVAGEGTGSEGRAV